MTAILPARRRKALGEFLRTHRGRLAPASLGFQAGRRRTPGLRREEVAQLCGLSATWITWLEQGRDVSASPQALATLAQALRLTPAERGYLFELAEKRDPAAPPAPGDDGMDAPAALADAVAAMNVPAYVLDRAWTARAWNPAAAQLFVGWLDRSPDKNLLRYVFLSPAARRIIPDWEARACRVLAEFRADSSRHMDDPALAALVEALGRDSPLFARAWRAHDVIERAGGERSFDHPRQGRLFYEQVSFTLASRPDFKLVMLMPRGLPRAGSGKSAR